MSYLDAAGPTPVALIDARNTDSEDTGDGEIVVQVEDDNGVDGVVIGVDGVGAGGEAGGGLLNDAQMGHSQFQGQGVTVDSAGELVFPDPVAFWRRRPKVGWLSGSCEWARAPLVVCIALRLALGWV